MYGWGYSACRWRDRMEGKTRSVFWSEVGDSEWWRMGLSRHRSGVQGAGIPVHWYVFWSINITNAISSCTLDWWMCVPQVTLLLEMLCIIECTNLFHHFYLLIHGVIIHKTYICKCIVLHICWWHWPCVHEQCQLLRLWEKTTGLQLCN